MAGQPLLARIVGHKKARELWYLCRQYDAQQALDMGLVNAVVPPDKLDEEVDKWCQELLEKIGQDATVADKVHALLERCEGGFPSNDEAAALLAMSGRTLRRKLHEEDSSFQDLLDQVRKERALTYLRETRLPLNSIALLLGFNDASNFRRAFERWTGRKPLGFRS